MYLEPINYPSVLSPGIVQLVADDYEPGTRKGSWSVDETRCNRNYVLRLKAITASSNIGAIQVIQSVGLLIGSSYSWPYYGDPTENDTGSYLQSIDVENTSDDGRQWAITLTYAPFDVWTLLGSSDLNKGIISPLDRAWEVYWGEPQKYKKSKPYDESGENEETGEPGAPYVNTVGDPLLDPPPTEETRPVLFLVRNESTYNDAYASQYKDAVNSDEFLGFPPNTVKCRDIKGERFWDPDWGWWFKVTYQFEFDYDDDGEGFTYLALNAGYRQLVNGTGSPVNVVDANGNTVTDAVPLKQNGAYEPGAEPYFIPFQEFPSVPFENLNIPDDLLYVSSGGGSGGGGGP